MNRLDQLARMLLTAGAPTLPTFVLVREMEVFELEFAALEFEEDATLPMIDAAVLSLVRALGAASPRDVDAYLGIGEQVSKELVLRLLDEKLLEPQAPSSTSTIVYLPAPGHDGTERTGRRVYELAKELGLLNKELIPKIRELGLEVNNHMSSLDRDDVARIKRGLATANDAREAAGNDSPADSAPPPVPPRFDVELQRNRVVVAVRPGMKPATSSDRPPNALYESRADHEPRCALTASGHAALEHGKLSRRRRRSVRLVFCADPLLFLTTADERRARYSKHLRPKVIQPAEVPPVFRRIDEVLSLAPELRASGCGLQRSVPGVRGTLLRVVPGAQWEVRPARDRSDSTPLVIVAGFATPDAEQPELRVYTCFNDTVVEREHLQSVTFVSLRSAGEFLAASGLGDRRAMLHRDGAFRLESATGDLGALVGNTDEAQDVYVEAAPVEGWRLGTRVHGVPADDETARAAFFEYLSRRDSSLRRDFDGTCDQVRAMLVAYWERQPALPTADDVAHALWDRRELRAALCMRRLSSDLVTPYLEPVQ